MPTIRLEHRGSSRNNCSTKANTCTTMPYWAAKVWKPTYTTIAAKPPNTLWKPQKKQKTTPMREATS